MIEYLEEMAKLNDRNKQYTTMDSLDHQKLIYCFFLIVTNLPFHMRDESRLVVQCDRSCGQMIIVLALSEPECFAEV